MKNLVASKVPVGLKTLCLATLMTLVGTAHANNLVGLMGNTQIGLVDSSNVGASTFKTITGDGAGELFIGIDLRPSNNQIYGISASNKLFTINAFTGSSTFVTNLSSSIIDTSKGYGFDFNPVADINGATSLRLVSTSGENFAINVTTGAVTLAGNIGGAFSGVSYANSDASMPTMAPASTQLYYIDTDMDTLSVATSAFNAPTINLIGSLGVDVVEANGFEVLANGSAFAAFTLDGSVPTSRLFSIDLATGSAFALGNFTSTLTGLTVTPVPEPETYALMLVGLAGLAAVARRKQKQS